MMILIIGLGNPGRKFRKTRHNLGRLVVSRWQKVVRFPKFKFEKKFNALISKGIFDNRKMILALPETFMNNSGKSVKLLVTRYRLPITNLQVVHDDIDLPIGKIKIVKNRGAAGHKGVQSIIDELGTKNFIRFRIGIKPKTYNLTPKTLDEFVLQKFNKKEEKILKEVIKRTCQAIEIALKEGVEKAMSRFNK